MVLLLASCGGESAGNSKTIGNGGAGNGGAGHTTTGTGAADDSINTGATAVPSAPIAAGMQGQAQASRFLAQASFGATMADIEQLATTGYTAWFDNQFAKPQSLHRNYVDAMTASTGKAATQNHFMESFWQQAVGGEDQLRQRVAFALSQIFVVSLQDSRVNDHIRGVASYYDTLAAHAFGNYRDLLEAVALHPMMGLYLTSIGNREVSGNRIPDQNFAREIMQLMSIGLHELNQDGSLKTEDGSPVETYTNADIAGLSRVFTGWSWYSPDRNDASFKGIGRHPDSDWRPMQSYPKYHSTSEKSFLGMTIPVGTTAENSLRLALDHLFNHPNVGPFIGRQIIQRLVTSNSSPQYIARVAAAFADNGAGVRGDMKAMIKAVLLDPEARADPDPNAPAAGKLREPVIRLANWMRAFHVKSSSSRFLLGNLDDTVTALGETPMRSPSVFNFYRPGYTPPNSATARAGKLSPEMQITGETSVVGYLNFMRDAIPNGVGTSHEVKADYAVELGLADTPAALLDRIDMLLLSKQMSAALRGQILGAVNSVSIPANSPANTAAARRNRVCLAIYLTMASPEYIVQK